MNEGTGPAAGATAKGSERISRFLMSRSKILSAAIVIAVIVPVVVVIVRITPTTDTSLPEAVDFRMWDTQTLDSIRLFDFRGKVVLLDFMATWCEACNESMPDLITIHETYSGDSFVLLSVTTDRWDTFDKMEKYRTDFGVDWTFAIPVDVVAVGAAYDVSGYPTTVVVNRDGRMTFRAVGLVPLETLVAPIEQALGL